MSLGLSCNYGCHLFLMNVTVFHTFNTFIFRTLMNIRSKSDVEDVLGTSFVSLCILIVIMISDDHFICKNSSGKF